MSRKSLLGASFVGYTLLGICSDDRGWVLGRVSRFKLYFGKVLIFSQKSPSCV